MIKKLIILVCLLLLPLTADADLTRRTWPFTSITGGAAGSLDGAVSGVSINSDDMAFGTHVTGGVTAWYFYRVEMSSTAENGFDVVAPDDVGAGTTRWHLITSADQKLSSGSTPTFLSVTADWMRSGASLIVDPPSGATLLVTMHNTIIRHDSANWDWWALPAISGVSTIYIKVFEGCAGSGITLQTTDSEPFLGISISGTSTWVLPAGNQFEATTLYGTANGTSIYWLVEETGSWETRP